MTPYRRGPWTVEEDKRLVAYIAEQGGPSNWVTIAHRMETRSAKQCRERYHQNLNPCLNKTPISDEEGRLIFKLYHEMGPKWAEIARRLNNRSDNAVKNYFNGCSNRRNRAEANRSNDRKKLKSAPVSHPPPFYNAQSIPQLKQSQPYYGPQYPLPNHAAPYNSQYQSNQYHAPAPLVTQYAQPLQPTHHQGFDNPLPSPAESSGSTPSLMSDHSTAQSPYSAIESPRDLHTYDASRRPSLAATFPETESKSADFSGRLFSQSQRSLPTPMPRLTARNPFSIPSEPHSQHSSYWPQSSPINAPEVPRLQSTPYSTSFPTTLEPQPSAPAPPSHSTGPRSSTELENHRYGYSYASANPQPMEPQFTVPSSVGRFETRSNMSIDPSLSDASSHSLSSTRPLTPPSVHQTQQPQSTSPSSRMAVADLVNN